MYSLQIMQNQIYTQPNLKCAAIALIIYSINIGLVSQWCLVLGYKDRVSKVPALGTHRIRITSAGVVANRSSAHLDGTAALVMATPSVVRCQVADSKSQVFEDCPPKLVFHGGGIRKPTCPCTVEELLEMDTSRAPAFIFYLFRKKYIFIVDGILDIPRSSHPLRLPPFPPSSCF